MASLFLNGISLLSTGLRSGATFVVALGAAGIIAQFTHAPPIFPALIASLVAAGMAFTFGAQDPFDADYASLSQISAHLVSSLAAIAGLLVIVNMEPAVGSFVCEPLVPWQSSIAIFGAFGTSWLSRSTNSKSELSDWANDPFGIFLDRPFYGFFHGPWFSRRLSYFLAMADPWLRQSLLCSAWSSRQVPGAEQRYGCFGNGEGNSLLLD